MFADAEQHARADELVEGADNAAQQLRQRPQKHAEPEQQPRPQPVDQPTHGQL